MLQQALSRAEASASALWRPSKERRRLIATLHRRAAAGTASAAVPGLVPASRETRPAGAASSPPELLQDKDPNRGRTGGWLAAHFHHELMVQAGRIRLLLRPRFCLHVDAGARTTLPRCTMLNCTRILYIHSRAAMHFCWYNC